MDCNSLRRKFLSKKKFRFIGNLIMNKYSIVSLFILVCLFDYKSYALTARISKCHHEGDFTVYCNRSKLPLTPSDPIEYIRSAKVIYGLYHNDTLCSYEKNTSCYKKQILTECIDKTYCNVKNGWYSLEPDCAGNSYYTEFEYDCQPAYFMCDKETVVHNVFSGLIYSPHFPNTFRSDKSEACYLTLHLPKNHHVEITLEYFDMLKTSKCVGDYVEIQQYKEINPINGDLKLYSKRSINNKQETNYTTGDIYNLNNENKKVIFQSEPSSHQLNRIKLSRTNRRPKYRWQTLGTMCGRIDKPYTIRATADTINFKFRPLPSSHRYVAALNNYPNKNHLGFKIYFQAIPPKAPPLEEDEETVKIANQIKYTTPIIGSDGFEDEQPNAKSQNSKQGISLTWIIASILIIIGITILLITIVGFGIFIIKRKLQNSKSTPATKNTKYTKAATSEPKKSVTAAAAAVSISNSNKNLKKGTDEEAAIPLNKQSSVPSTSNVKPDPIPAKPTPSATVNKPLSAGSSSKLSAAADPDSRKMIGELPVLLQDLSQSKLLLKFKQQETSCTSSATPISNNDSKLASEAVDNSLIAASQDTQEKKDQTSSSQLTGAPSNIRESSNLSSISGKKSITSELLTKERKTSISNQSDHTLINQQQQHSKSSTASVSPQSNTKSTKKNKTSIDNTSNSTTSVRSKLDVPKTNRPSPSKLTPLSSGIYGIEDSLDSGVYGADSSTLINTKPPTSNHVLTNSDNKSNKNTNQTPENNINTSNNNQDNVEVISKSLNNTTPRKTAFNPLHVILKDKNKYHTTEYI